MACNADRPSDRALLLRRQYHQGHLLTETRQAQQGRLCQPQAPHFGIQTTQAANTGLAPGQKHYVVLAMFSYILV